MKCPFYISCYHSTSILFSRTHFKNSGYWLGNQNIFFLALHSSDLSWWFLWTSNINSRWLEQCENSLPEIQPSSKRNVNFFSFFSISQSTWSCYLETTRMLFWNTENVPQCPLITGLSTGWFHFHIFGLSVLYLSWNWS